MDSRFNGLWKIDLGRSRQWDWSADKWVPDMVEREDIEICLRNGVLEWDLWAGIDPAVNMYAKVTIDGDWAPYICRELKFATPEGEARRQAEASKLNMPLFRAGETTALLKVIRVTDTYLVRVSRTPDGRTANYIMSTELTGPDERTSILTSPDGQPVYHRIFTRAG